MISKHDIQKLAALSRIKLTSEEEASVAGDMENILGYVQQIQDVSAQHTGTHVRDTNAPHNVLRADEEPHQSGAYTEALLAATPARHGNYVKVKKIL